MYHHHGPRPPHHQPPPNQHPNRNPSNMMPQPMGFQFSRPTQLPDELESALAIRGVSDMDHRLMDHMSRPNQHQNQSSGPGMSQHGGFGSNPMTLPPDQSGVDWSGYQPPAKLFAGPPPHAGHQSQQHRGPQQRPQSWKPPLSDSHSTQARHPQGGGESQGMYTPESAGSILASFGLSNEDLEVLSHYPDDQLTPDTLPFILRDIQINKSGTQNSAASASSFSHSIQDMPLPPSHSSPLTRSRSPEVPSLLAVTQTAGKVIDYGHASRAEDETPRETFKREPLSSERTVKMYPSPMASAPKPVKPERRQVRLEHTEPSKHRDQDYRRTINDHRKRSRSPRREFQLSPKPHAQDRDYRREAPRPRPSSEPRSEASSGRSPSSSSSSKPHIGGGSKKLPTPTMISDFSAASPKVYPHTCSLCHTQCDQEKDWINHINTVNHTAACRDLRNRYPDWKPNIPSGSGRHGSRTSRSPPQSASASRSVSPSPPHSKHRVGPPHQRPHGRPYPPHYDSHHQVNKGGPFRSSLKRPNDETSHQPSSTKTSHGTRHGPPQSATKAVKVGTKPGAKTTKTASGKAADTPAKPPPAKKKKKVAPAPSQDSSVADRLVYLMGIPQDASEQEVTDLVGSFGKINNVILMPCSEEEGEKDKGQKASVCMIKAEDAQALAKSAELQIREQKITAITAKKPKEEKSNGANSSAESAGQDKGADCRETGAEADQQLPEEKCKVLITGLPDSGWSESNIAELVQPFGMPSDIIAAAQIGKVLVSMQDTDTVQEMVKVNTFRPLKMGDAELKLLSIKQSISLSTPVALYNLLMGSANPLESPSLVSWSSLLVIRNVPSMPSASCEVQKLVRRFGTVIKTLVLSNMVICEMATAAMALSVYKRFQAFPCIIHNSPLFFSRKADPKTNTPNKVISAYLDSAEETPANGKDSNSSEAPEEEKAAEPSAEAKEDKDVNMEEKTQSTEAKAEEEASGENGSKEDKDEAAPEPAAAPEVKPEADVETKKTPTVETTKGGKDVGESRAKSDKPAGKAKTSDGKAASQKTPSKEQPKVAPEKTTPPQEKSKTNQESKSNKTETPANKKQEAQPQKKSGQKSTTEAKESTRSMAEEEAARMREKEQKEREARKEKERKDRERREREKEERAKKEKERAERAERSKKERERRDEERRERERRRLYGDGYIGKRSSSRSEGRRRSSEREEQKKTLEEQEEMDDFPFNLSDFVTVDEVGDVADIPSSPPSAVLEDGEKEAPVTVQKVKEEDKPAEETGTSDATETQPQASENVEEDGLMPSDQTAGPVLPAAGTSQPDSAHEPTPGPTGQPEDHGTESTQTAAPDSASEPHPLPTPADSPSHPPEMEKTEQEEEEEQPDEAVSDIEVKQEKEEAVSEAQGKEEQQETSDGGRVNKEEEEEEEVKEEAVDSGRVNKEEEEEEMKEEAVDSGRVKKEEEEEEVKEQEEIDDSRRVNKEEEEEETLVSNRAGDEEEKQSRDPAALSVKHERPEEEEEEEEESTKKKIRTDEPLPPFDPNNPVGMKYLVPKTGFFCKVCNRFFSGTKEAEINHCKTLKHYENLQKFLQSRKTVNEASKRDPS